MYFLRAIINSIKREMNILNISTIFRDKCHVVKDSTPRYDLYFCSTYRTVQSTFDPIRCMY
jgi:hypothetical protein